MTGQARMPSELTLEPATVVRTRRPRALWAVLAAVGLAAGALVVTSAGDDGTQRPGLPVALGSAIGRPVEGAMAADSMLAWITYVAGDDLPALGGEAPAYRLRGDVDEAPGAERWPTRSASTATIESRWRRLVVGHRRRLLRPTRGRAPAAARRGSYFAGDSDCVEPDGGIASCYAEAGDCVDSASGPEDCGHSVGGDARRRLLRLPGRRATASSRRTTIAGLPGRHAERRVRARTARCRRCPRAGAAPAADLPPLEGEEEARHRPRLLAATGAGRRRCRGHASTGRDDARGTSRSSPSSMASRSG